jgi:hypothetical protein
MKLSGPMTISEVAALYGWTYCKTKAHLLKRDAEERKQGRKLLSGGPKPDGGWEQYRVSLAGLARVDPDSFAVMEGVAAKLEELEEKLQERELAERKMAAELAVVRRQLSLALR